MARKRASSPLGEGKLAALKLLKHAFDDAEDVGKESQQFAVSRSDLANHGVSESDLRWLLEHRYAEQLEEITRRGHEGRQFSVVTGLRLSPNGCFVLTYGGKTFIDRHNVDGPAAAKQLTPTAKTPRERIRWDRDRHELWVDGQLAKRFLHRARAQWPVLDAFDDNGWRGPIAIDPPGDADRDASQRLRELVAELNTNLDTSLIRFRKDPAGDQITFDLP